VVPAGLLHTHSRRSSACGGTWHRRSFPRPCPPHHWPLHPPGPGLCLSVPVPPPPVRRGARTPMSRPASLRAQLTGLPCRETAGERPPASILVMILASRPYGLPQPLDLQIYDRRSSSSHLAEPRMHRRLQLDWIEADSAPSCRETIPLRLPAAGCCRLQTRRTVVHFLRQGL
jgi:hypothetical protein